MFLRGLFDAFGALSATVKIGLLALVTVLVGIIAGYPGQGSGGGGVVITPTPTPTPTPTTSPTPEPTPTPTPTPTGTPDFGGVLGGNYNEHYQDIDIVDLQKANAQWIRTFVRLAQGDRDAAIAKLLDTGDQGYKTILSLKWVFEQRDFPQPGTPAMQTEINRIDSLLAQVMGKVDILVIGNEPYIDTAQQYADADLNAFYELMADRVIAYRTQNCVTDCKTRLYMGALNRLDLPERITPSVERWMQYVKDTPQIDGVDIHPHIPRIEASRPFLDYILPRMRDDQRFIVTEFSLIWWWGENQRQTVSTAFADAYGLPHTTYNWEVIKSAVETPFTKKKWDDFLSLSPWFENRKRYLSNQMRIFRNSGKLAVATYAFRQSQQSGENYGPDKTPWILNGVYAPVTVQANPDGSAPFNYAWIDDFRQLARNP
ncbi:hypothetical protein [Sphingomonas suaedae]|uniref:hypothetical protein n=1 Tax=Sphingomonas suaedae TaxID=2599297 RepID=UPI00164544EE|nr:hypothetical protein [Sphingomonas suaedae]